MEVSQRTFSFTFDSAEIDMPIHFGNFKYSSWSFVLNRNGSMKITRSNCSQTFSISIDITFICLYITEKRMVTRSIFEGQADVILSLNIDKMILAALIAEVKKFEVIIFISQLPPTTTASSSKETEAFNNSLTKRIPPLPENLQPLLQLSNDLLSLLNNPDSLPDATFKCGAEEILVHKAILSARSPVFAAMFKNQMQESSSGIVEIVDIEPNVLQATLKFVYGGKTNHLVNDGIAGDVLFAANKYQLEELKKACVDKLKSSLTVDNVFRALALGDLHDECLKTQAKEFVCKCGKFSNLAKTEGWKLLQTENPGLAMEVMLFVVDFAQK